jgi:hypothetical protein
VANFRDRFSRSRGEHPDQEPEHEHGGPASAGLERPVTEPPLAAWPPDTPGRPDARGAAVSTPPEPVGQGTAPDQPGQAVEQMVPADPAENGDRFGLGTSQEAPESERNGSDPGRQVPEVREVPAIAEDQAGSEETAPVAVADVDQEAVDAVRPWSPYAAPATEPDDFAVNDDTLSPTDPVPAAEPDRPARPWLTAFITGLKNSTGIAYLKVDGDFYLNSGQWIDYSDIGEHTLESQVKEVFVEPTGFGSIKAELKAFNSRVVVLAAEEGGHDFAARALLLACAGLKPRRIGPRSGPKVQPAELAYRKGTAWLLNLTDLEDVDWDDLLEHLIGLGDELKAQHSVLVVVVNTAELDASLIRKHGLQEIPRPDPYRVFERHLAQQLRAGEVMDPTKTPAAWGAYFRGKQRLDREAPAVAVRLSAAVLYAEQHWAALTPGMRQEVYEDFTNKQRLAENAGSDACVEVLAADRFGSWTIELDLWNLDHLDQPLLKAFQLAAALLPSGDPVAARKAAIDLLERAFPEDQPPRSLDGPGVRLMAGMIGAELRDGTITFPRPGYREAIVRYFWEDRPQIHQELLAWMLHLAAAADKDDRQELTDRIGAIALDHAQQTGKLAFLTDVVTSWAASGADTLPAAVELLERAASTNGIASAVRKLMLTWAQKGDKVKKRVVGEVCASPGFASRHPRLQIYRLGYLMDDQARREYDAVPQHTLLEACALQIRLGNTGIVLGMVAKHLDSVDTGLVTRAARLFVPLAKVPSADAAIPALVVEAALADTTEAALVAAWSAALRHLDSAELQPAFNAWMNACATPEFESQVFAIWTAAIEHHPGEASKASHKGTVLADRWQDQSPFDPDRTRQLRNGIEDALREVADAITRKHHHNSNSNSNSGDDA